MNQRLTVILSHAPGSGAAKRKLEQEIVVPLLDQVALEVTLIPHLYDLRADSPAVLGLHAIGGSMVLLSWLYPRAAHWILDQHGVRGRMMQLGLGGETSKLNEKWVTSPAGKSDGKDRLADRRPMPSRSIYYLDLRCSTDPAFYLDEIQQIAAECQVQPATFNAVGAGGQSDVAPSVTEFASIQPPPSPRRWYPVIDYSRCTNCMECIDFCLFGVYGIDHQEQILVEQPDYCRQGCPACSRVCPEDAILFPQHKMDSIAGGADAARKSAKIDLSQLFGLSDALATAAEERERHVANAGRESAGYGATDEASKPPATSQPARDDLDDLVDELDKMDL